MFSYKSLNLSVVPVALLILIVLVFYFLFMYSRDFSTMPNITTIMSFIGYEHINITSDFNITLSKVELHFELSIS